MMSGRATTTMVEERMQEMVPVSAASVTHQR